MYGHPKTLLLEIQPTFTTLARRISDVCEIYTLFLKISQVGIVELDRLFNMFYEVQNQKKYIIETNELKLKLIGISSG